MSHEEEATSLVTRAEWADNYHKAPLLAQAHVLATLALVEATERLALAQETANLIANTAMLLATPASIQAGMSDDAKGGAEAIAEVIGTRLAGYLK